MPLCLSRCRKCRTLGVVSADCRNTNRRKSQPLLHRRGKCAFVCTAFHNFRQNPVGNVEKRQEFLVPCAGFRRDHLRGAGDGAFCRNRSSQQIGKQIRHRQHHFAVIQPAALLVADQLEQGVDLHDLGSRPGIQVCRCDGFFCLFQNAAGAAVPIVPRQFQERSVGFQQSVVYAPGINGNAFIGRNFIRRLHSLLDLTHQLRDVPVQSAVFGNRVVGKAVYFPETDLFPVIGCQHGSAGRGAQIQRQYIAVHAISSGRTTPFFSRMLA